MRWSDVSEKIVALDVLRHVDIVTASRLVLKNLDEAHF